MSWFSVQRRVFDNGNREHGGLPETKPAWELAPKTLPVAGLPWGIRLDDASKTLSGSNVTLWSDADGREAAFGQELAGVAQFFDPRVGITITTGHVSTWTDREGGSSLGTNPLTRPTLNAAAFGGSADAVDTTSGGFMTLASRRTFTTGHSFCVLFATVSAGGGPAAYAGDSIYTLIGDTTGSVVNSIGLDDSGNVEYHYFDGASWQLLTTSGSGLGPYNDGNYHVAVVVHDQATGFLGLYVDQLLVADATQTYSASSWGWNVLATGFAADQFNGQIGPILTFDRALNYSEVRGYGSWIQLNYINGTSVDPCFNAPTTGSTTPSGKGSVAFSANQSLYLTGTPLEISSPFLSVQTIGELTRDSAGFCIFSVVNPGAFGSDNPGNENTVGSSFYSDDGGYVGLVATDLSSGSLVGYTNDNTGEADASFTVSTSTWYLVTHNATGANLYVLNNVSAKTSPIGAADTHAGPWTTASSYGFHFGVSGAERGYTGFLSGSIAAFYLYPSSPSAARMRDIQRYLFESFLLPAQWWPSFPDPPSKAPLYALRQNRHASRMQTWAGPIAPIVVAALTPVDLFRYPDTIARPRLATGNHRPTDRNNVTPERTQPMADMEWPDWVRRPSLRPENQLATPSEPPQPEKKIAVSDTVFPPTVLRPKFATAEQQAALSVMPKPERVAPLADQNWPDRIVRPVLSTAQQLASPNEIQAPERTLPLADQEWPDRVPRPMFRAEQQLATTSEPPEPERTLSLADNVRPDRVPRPIFGSGLQHSFPFAAPAPEQTTGLADVSVPARVVRPVFAAPLQLATTNVPPAPERTLVATDVSRPDRIVRPFVPVAQQPAYLVFPSQPERTLPDFDTVHPDIVLRPKFLTDQQVASPTPHPYPIPLDEPGIGYGWYPDFVSRPKFHADQQRSVDFVVLVTVTPSSDLFRFPDLLLRTVYHPSRQQVAAPDAMQPEETSQLADSRWPDRVPRPAFESRQQVASLSTPPQPEQTEEIAVSVYPDAVNRPRVAAALQFAVTRDIQQPERTNQLADMEWPDRILRPMFRAEQQQWTTGISPEPEQPLPPTFVSWPDRVPRPVLAAAQQPFWTSSPKPEQPQAQALYQYPEAVRRPTLRADKQPFTTDVPSYPIPLPQPGAGYAFYPDSVFRPVFRTERQQTTAENIQPEQTIELPSAVWPDRIALRPAFRAENQPYFAFAPQPEATVEYPSVSWPDRVFRPIVRATDQPFRAEQNVQPEEQLPIPDSRWADRVPRPSFRGEQQPYTTNVPAKPEQPTQMSAMSWPDRIVLRPTFRAENQPYFAFAPQPEAPIAYPSVVWPDRVLRPLVRASDQPFTSEQNIQPEEQIQIPDSRWADRVVRPVFRSGQQPYTTSIPPQPEQPTEISAVSWPDRVLRPTTPTAQQPFFTFAPSPLPQAQSGAGYTLFPDRVPRPSLPTANQMAPAALYPLPETTKVPLAWNPVYEDRIVRPDFKTAQQPYFTFWPVPIPVAALTQLQADWASFPTRIVRPSFGVSEQLFATNIPTAPERTLQLADVEGPDRVVRPMFRAEQQPWTTGIPAQPERAVPATDGYYPEVVRRSKVRTDALPFASAAPIAPERTSTAFDFVYPDIVRRPMFRAASQLDSVRPPPEPERSSPLADSLQPERVRRPLYLVALQQVAPILPQQPESPTPEAFVYYPERVLRPKLATADQQDTTNLSPHPEGPLPEPSVSAPVAVRRPFFLGPHQLWTSRLPEAPEQPLALSSVESPAAVRRPALHASLHQAAAISQNPELPVSEPSVVWPDQILRPRFLPPQQAWSTELPPAPEQTSSLADSLFPPTVLGSRFLPYNQQAFAQPPLIIDRLDSPPLYPDSVRRPALLASAQAAATRPDQLPTFIPTFFEAEYVDRVLRPMVDPRYQRDVAPYPLPIGSYITLSVRFFGQTFAEFELTQGHQLPPPLVPPFNGPVLSPSAQLGYRYLPVPLALQRTVPPHSPMFRTQGEPTQVIETELANRGIIGEIIHLESGDIVYRVPARELWKLEQDKAGFFVRSGKTKYRFVSYDPTVGQTILDFWKPLL